MEKKCVKLKNIRSILCTNFVILISFNSNYSIFITLMF